MLIPMTEESRIAAFRTACAYERVFGSKILTAMETYGLTNPNVRFWLLEAEGKPAAALYWKDDVLVISAREGAPVESVAALIRELDVKEVDTNLRQCEALQQILGGTTESSYYMVYSGGTAEGDFSDMEKGDLQEVFSVLQASHEYYRTHLRFETWSQDLEQRQKQGCMELYQLRCDGRIVGTGSIASMDDACGVIAAVAVIPEYRHRGLGSHISRFLVNRILKTGKTPRLISGYDEVAELYGKIGFEPCGRWGELYL